MAIEALNPNKLLSSERFTLNRNERSPIKDGLEVVGKIVAHMYNKAVDDLHQVKSLVKDAISPDSTKTPFENAFKVLTDASVPHSLQEKLVGFWETRIKS